MRASFPSGSVALDWTQGCSGRTHCGAQKLPSSTGGLATLGPFSFCSEGRHTAHEQQAEARITYRFHPRFGEIVRVRRRLQRGGAAFLVVHQLDGTFACLPAWMTDEAASGFEISVEPHFPLDVLCSLRNEVESGRSLVSHPRRKAGKGAVK